ncbi:MAG: CCA tRNA nucleotidyltransferase, partial [Candidatus Aminicenantes bacterium]|nr:CCA tRNA nucleotidyltransferase [Candidatus Aminicenantes bacterium]
FTMLSSMTHEDDPNPVPPSPGADPRPDGAGEISGSRPDLGADAEAPPLVIEKPNHSISRRDVDPDALGIIHRLHRFGFRAYLTGGAVRDMMLGRTPKDFDVVTDARPGQIRKRFANCFIIGRRFRLAHIRFREGKIIEVATFRRVPDRGEEVPPGAPVDPSLIYGTPREDAFRRDITINALFYDPDEDLILDYVGGVEDLKRGVVRVIGDPAVRFAEDPVRVWRVLRHAARLGFRVDAGTEREIPAQNDLLAACSGARLFEELNKDLAYETRPVFGALRSHGLLGVILGKAGRAYESDPALFGRLDGLLDVEDRFRRAELKLSPEEMYALIFWPWVEPLFGEGKPDDYHTILYEMFDQAGMKVTIPRKLKADLVQLLTILGAASRALRTGRMRWSLAKRSHFGQAGRLGYLILKERPPQPGETLESLIRESLSGLAPEDRTARKRKRRRRRKPREGEGRPPGGEPASR